MQFSIVALNVSYGGHSNNNCIIMIFKTYMAYQNVQFGSFQKKLFDRLSFSVFWLREKQKAPNMEHSKIDTTHFRHCVFVVRLQQTSSIHQYTVT